MKAYKKRMIKEFDDLNDRCKKLEKTIRKFDAGKLEFELNCPITMLKEQHEAMLKYRACLKQRAIVEDIDLEY